MFVASVAVQLTVVVPMAKVPPLAGEQATVGLESTASVAVTLYVTVAPDAEVASTVILLGKLSAGAVESRTVIVKEPLD